MASLIRKGNRWYGVFFEGGRQRWRSLKTSNKDEAHKRLGELIRRREAEINGEKPPLQDLRWSEFSSKYEVYARANKEKSSVVRDLIVLRNVSRHLPVEWVSQINLEMMERYKMLRREAGIMPSTLNREITLLRAASKLGRNWGYLCPDIGGLKRLPETRRRPDFFTEEELRVIVREADPLLKTVALLGYLAGLRRDELLHIRWGDVDLEKGLVRLTPYEGWHPKDKEAREIWLHADLKAHLTSWEEVCRGKELVVPWGKAPHQLSGAFTKLLRKCGIPHGSLHSLRRSFASLAAMRGMDLYRIGQLMGHSSTEMTKVYAYLLPSSLREVVDVLPSVTGGEAGDPGGISEA